MYHSDNSRRDGDKKDSRPRAPRRDNPRFRPSNNEEDESPRRSAPRDGNGRGDRKPRTFEGRPRNNDSRTRTEGGREGGYPRRSDSRSGAPRRDNKPRRSFDSSRDNGYEANESYRPNRPARKPAKPAKSTPPQPKVVHEEGAVRLNKYIAHAGICSRREADKLIAAGSVSVNGKVVTEMGYQVMPGDTVSYGGETLRSEAPRYFLLNKPKGFITTLDDPQERQTVMMLIDGACKERIYPVGRLDRNTTGLLLFTNDGEMAKKLTHPSTGVYKIYHVELNKPVTRDDMRQMLEGIELEDGFIHVDDVQYVADANDKRVVGVELHSGKNRIVRRIFEHLGYDVHKLDRVVFAGLTKKDLPRGRYRELTPKEIAFLKMI